MQKRLFTLSDVAAAIGEKPRCPQIWAENGILQPVHKTSRRGSGTRRLFDFDELLIAAILVIPARLQTPTSILLDISRRIRGMISTPLFRKTFQAVLDAPGKDLGFLLAIRFAEIEEDGFGSSCEIWEHKTKWSVGPAIESDSTSLAIGAGAAGRELPLLIPLNRAFDNLATLT